MPQSQRKRALSDGKEHSGSQNSAGTMKKSKQTLSLSNLCVQCDELATDLNSVCCTVCTLRHHTTCCGWKTKILSNDLLIIKELGWVCPVCQDGARATLDTMRSEHSKLALVVFELQSKLISLEKLQADQSIDTATAKAAADTALSVVQKLTDSGKGTGSSNVWGSLAVENSSDTSGSGSLIQSIGPLPVVGREAGLRSEVESIVRHTIQDTNRRKLNVIISGLNESAQHSDADLVKDLCTSELGFHPSIVHLGTRRLGKSKNNKPCRLLVRLGTEEQVRDLLARSRNLRRSANSYTPMNIFVNPDLSPDEAKAAYDRRQLRRAGITRAAANIDTTRGRSNLIVVTCEAEPSPPTSSTTNSSTLMINASATMTSSTSPTTDIGLDPTAMAFRPSSIGTTTADIHPSPAMSLSGDA